MDRLKIKNYHTKLKIKKKSPNASAPVMKLVSVIEKKNGNVKKRELPTCLVNNGNVK